MVQDIITYFIIGAAVVLAFLKFYKKFGRKKSVKNVEKPENRFYSDEHKCEDCPAECLLRNSVNTFKDSESNLCEKIEVRRNSE